MNNDILNKIEKLANLKDKGILSQEEFESKKKILLNAFENDTKVSTVHTEDNTASIWMAIFGSMFGFLVFIIPFEDGKWDKDTVIGFIFFAFIAIALAVASLKMSNKGASQIFSIITIVLTTFGIFLAVANSS